MIKIALTVFIMLMAFNSYASLPASSLACKDEAFKDAKKLLSFYRDNDDRIEIDDSIKPLARIKNPANKNQSFDVLEVWGTIYKGKYRMRLIYSTDSDCLLMGEEILEYANL